MALMSLVTLMLLAAPAESLTLDQIHLRDPFILTVPEEHRYYLFGTGWRLPGGPGFMLYTSEDLTHWRGPEAAFTAPEGFVSDNYWAPEVHRYHGRYYLFGTFMPRGEGAFRQTRILVSDKPGGPYHLYSDGPATPKDWFSLDGTLFVDEAGAPWIVFCHEWVQVGDGEVCAVRLAADLSKPVGNPVLLFKASAAPWVREIGGERHGRVTDGPFLHRTVSGALLMSWSSFGEGGYKLAVAHSESGRLRDPWRQEVKPLIENDGGHGMLFRTFDGALMLVLHQPNGGGKERPRLLRVKEKGEGLALGE